jgi:stearoyl-CoA desaturase (delta-9 desaturase)
VWSHVFRPPRIDLVIHCKTGAILRSADTSIPNIHERLASEAHLAPEQIARPAARKRMQINWRVALGIVFYHLVALLAFVPGFFSWTGLTLAVLGIYFFGGLGINLCYHRLLAHRSFTCPRWFEHCLALIGLLNLQEAPARWVAIHRRHHHHADKPADPHSPVVVNFFWSHMGWLMLRNELYDLAAYHRYAADILRDPFYKTLERHFFSIVMASWVVFFVAGFAGAMLAGDTLAQSLRFGGIILLWGVFVRTVLVWHITWSVNSLGHVSGYRTYPTSDDSRNSPWVQLITLGSGEGWHNNHHADPGAARSGHTWWEFDGVYHAIQGLAWLGLASNVVGRQPSTLAVKPR